MAILEQFGFDFGNFIKTIMLSVDPEMIIIGGNLTHFFQYFEDSMWKNIQSFPYQKSINKLKIETSSYPDIEILGAAALYFDAERNY